MKTRSLAHQGHPLIFEKAREIPKTTPPKMRARAVLKRIEEKYAAKVLVAAIVRTEMPNTIQPIIFQLIFASFFLLGAKIPINNPTKIKKLARTSKIPVLARRIINSDSNIGMNPLSKKFTNIL